MDNSKPAIPRDIPSASANVKEYLGKINRNTQALDAQYLAEVIFWALGGATYYWDMMLKPPAASEIGLIVDEIIVKLAELEASHKGISSLALRTRVTKGYGKDPRGQPGGSREHHLNIIEALLFEYERHTIYDGAEVSHATTVHNTKTDWNKLHIGALHKLLQRGAQMPLPPKLNPGAVHCYHFYNWPELLFGKKTQLFAVSAKDLTLLSFLTTLLSGEDKAQQAGLLINDFNSMPSVDNLRLLLDYPNFTAKQQVTIFTSILNACVDEDLLTLLYKTISHFVADYRSKKSTVYDLDTLLQVIPLILGRIKGSPAINQKIASNRNIQIALITLIQLYTDEVRAVGSISEKLEESIKLIVSLGVPMLEGGTDSVLFTTISYHIDGIRRIVVHNQNDKNNNIIFAKRLSATPQLLFQLLERQKFDESSLQNSKTLFFDILVKIALLTEDKWQQGAEKIYADACLEEYANILKLLLEKGMDVNSIADQRHARTPINPLLLLASNPILRDKCLLLALQKANESTIVYKPKEFEPVFRIDVALVEYLKNDQFKEWDQTALDIVKTVASKTKSDEVYKVEHPFYLFWKIATQKRPHNQYSRAICASLLDAKVPVGLLPLENIQDDELLELILDKGNAPDIQQALNNGMAFYNLIHRLANLDNISDLQKRVVTKMLQRGAHAADAIRLNTSNEFKATMTPLVNACMSKHPTLVEIMVSQQPEEIAKNITVGRIQVTRQNTPGTQYNGSALFYLLRNDHITQEKRKELIELLLKAGADPAVYHMEDGYPADRSDTAPLAEVLIDSKRYKDWTLGEGKDIFCYLMENVKIADPSNTELVKAKLYNMSKLVPMLANLLFTGSVDRKSIKGDINADRIITWVAKCDALSLHRNFMRAQIKNALKARLVADQGMSDDAINTIIDYLKCPSDYVGSLLQDFLQTPETRYRKAILFLLKRPEVADFIKQKYQTLSKQPAALENTAGKYTPKPAKKESAPPEGYDCLAAFISGYANKLSVNEFKEVVDSMLAAGAIVSKEAIKNALTHTWDKEDTQILDYLLSKSNPERLKEYKNDLLPNLVDRFKRELWNAGDYRYKTADEKKGVAQTSTAKMLKLLAHLKGIEIDTGELEELPEAEEELVSWSVAHYLYSVDSGSAAALIQQLKNAGHNPFNHGKSDLDIEAVCDDKELAVHFVWLTLLDYGLKGVDADLVAFALDKGAALNSEDEGKYIMPASAVYSDFKRANFLHLIIKQFANCWRREECAEGFKRVEPILKIINQKRPGKYQIVNTEHAYEGEPYTLFGLLCLDSKLQKGQEKTTVEMKISIINLLFDLGLDVRVGHNNLARALNDAAWNPEFLAALKDLLTSKGIDYSEITITEQPRPKPGIKKVSGSAQLLDGGSDDDNHREVNNQKINSCFTPPSYLITGGIVLTASAIGSIPLILAATKVIEIPAIQIPGVPDIASHISTAMIGFAFTAITIAAVVGTERGVDAAAIAGITVLVVGTAGTALVEWAAPLVFTHLSVMDMHLAMGVTYAVISIGSAVILAISTKCQQEVIETLPK